jgi:hypothetical protein
VAVWRWPKLTARGDPDHDHAVAGVVARLIELPRRSVVLAVDETHLNLLPHVRASWTLRTARPKIHRRPLDQPLAATGVTNRAFGMMLSSHRGGHRPSAMRTRPSWQSIMAGIERRSDPRLTEQAGDR